MPNEEEENRVSKIKYPKGEGGDYKFEGTPLLFPNI